MTTLTPARVAAPLGPINAALDAMSARHGEAAVHGIIPNLLVPPCAYGWAPATSLVNGARLPALLSAAERRWNAAPHAAAALAWKSYTYWVALPAVLGWAAARRVPLLHPSDVLVRFAGHKPFLSIGLRRTVVAVLPSDPLAAAGVPGVHVVADEADLLATLRGTLLDDHLAPMLDRIHDRVRLGHRTLLGSLASGVAYGVLRAADALPGSAVENIDTLLGALGVADLVSLVPKESPGERSRSRGPAEASTPPARSGERGRSRGPAEASTPPGPPASPAPTEATGPRAATGPAAVPGSGAVPRPGITGPGPGSGSPGPGATGPVNGATRGATATTDSGEELIVLRRTCCLAFTLPEPKICSGCCIRTAS